MKGMVDGRLLKRAWDANELGDLLLGIPPYDYETGADSKAAEQARFTRLRQVIDFLRCRSARERARVLQPTISVLDRSGEQWARVSAVLIRRTFGSDTEDSTLTTSE